MNPLIHSKTLPGLKTLIAVVVVCFGLLMSHSLAQKDPKKTLKIPQALLFKNFDLVVTSRDANGLPLNPKWGQQVRDDTLPSPRNSCPLATSDPGLWTSAQFPNCTSHPVFFNGADFCLGHHVNFSAVTYEGLIYFDGGPFKPWPVGDDDYMLNLARADKALYTAEDQQVHVEFDAGETVDQWDGRDVWWRKFHEGTDEARQAIDGHFAIVIGLLGLDAERGSLIPGTFDHRGKPELHPVYAIFVTVEQSRKLRETTWAFFVRNWGNEGYCGGDQMNMYGQPIRVQIPRAMQIIPDRSRMWKGARQSVDLSAISVGVESNAAGLLLSFTLLAPERQSWIVGDLTVQDRILPPGELPESEVGEKVPSPVRVAENEQRENVPPHFAALQAQMENLPESARKELLAQQQRVIPKGRATREEPTIIAAPTQRGNTYLKSPERVVPTKGLQVRPQRDVVGESIRRKKLEILKEFLAKRGGGVDLQK